MQVLYDILINIAITVVIAVITSLIATVIKKGEFYDFGYSIGKLLSKLGSSKFGKINWEKLEDVLICAIISFSHGIQKGADSDDENLTNNKNNGVKS